MSRSDLLATIMWEHRDGLVSYAEKMLGDRGLAEHIAQETTIRAWRKIDRLLTMEGSVRGRLFTVTRHLVIDWVRKPHARREVVGDSHHDPVSGTDGTAPVHDALVVRPLLRRLSPEHRAVLVHIYLCDRTIKETAGILGVPPAPSRVVSTTPCASCAPSWNLRRPGTPHSRGARMVPRIEWRTVASISPLASCMTDRRGCAVRGFPKRFADLTDRSRRPTRSMSLRA
ncbi:sigma factor [Streptomyces sp. NPDC002785]|uniref:sigma factor n=1 Tax=Streptomyces sp. NPDC002785 TaxID=3154543 RepID=UPI00331EF093